MTIRITVMKAFVLNISINSLEEARTINGQRRLENPFRLPNHAPRALQAPPRMIAS